VTGFPAARYPGMDLPSLGWAGQQPRRDGPAACVAQLSQARNSSGMYLQIAGPCWQVQADLVARHV